MKYLSVSDNRTYEVKTEKVKGSELTFIRCLNCECKSENWNPTTAEHVKRLIDFDLLKPIINKELCKT